MPLAGPGYGVLGAGWRSWAAAAIASNTNNSTSTMAVPRRTPRG